MSNKQGQSRTQWPTVPISRVAWINPPAVLPPADFDDRAVPLFEMAAIDEYSGTLCEPKFVPLGTCRSGKTKFQNGDILFAKITPCVENGKSAIVAGVDGDLAFGSSEFYVLRPSRVVLPEFLFYYLRQKKVIEAAVASFTGTSGRQRVPRSFWDELEIPLPLLPVQERIVQILQKADELRRKRKQALELADKILPALFLEMFGDPIANPRNWPTYPLGKCALIKRGLSKRPSPQGNIPIVRIKNLTLEGLDLSWSEFVEATDEEVERGRLADGDIIFSPLNGSLNHLAKSDIFYAQNGKTWVLDSNLCAFRANKEVVRPLFLATWLSLPQVLEYFRTRLAVRTSGGQWLLKNSTLSAIPVPIPPLSQQDFFVQQAEQYLRCRAGMRTGLEDAEKVFSSILSRAFTGELTAEWEEANAEWIAEQQALYERLPRLVLLALIAEKVRRIGRWATEVLVTAVMKYAFLLQMEGNLQRRLYHFVPYHYGPFAKEVYADLRNLQEEGLIRVDGDADENKTRITLTDLAKVDEALTVLPVELKEDIETIINSYGDLDHNALLKMVYEKYPAYTTKSRVRWSDRGGRKRKEHE